MYTISKVKTFTGMEGGGYNFTLLKDGKEIATFLDDASGGGVYYQFHDRVKEDDFLTFIKAEYPDIQFDAVGVWAENQMNIHDNVTRFNKMCSTKVVFMLPNDNELYTLNRKKSIPLEAYVEIVIKRYGAGAVIINYLPIAERKRVLTEKVETDIRLAEEEEVA